MITKTEAIFLGVGFVAHAAFLASASRVPAPVYHLTEPDPVAYAEIETPEKEEPPPPPEDSHDREIAANTTERVAPRAVSPEQRTSQRPRTSHPTDDAPEIEPAPGGTTADEPSPTGEHPGVQFDEPSNDRPGLPGVDQPVWMMPDVMGPIGMAGPPAPTTAPKAKKISRDKANEVLGDALKAKDKQLGLQLAAAGTVASTVKDAVWSVLPDVAQGSFVVVLGADGKVQSVKVATQSGGSAADWEAVAANVKAALSSRALNLTDEYKKGAIITVAVVSKRQLPSGSDPSSPISFGTTSTFDISDIGAKSIRQVRTQTNVTPIK